MVKLLISGNLTDGASWDTLVARLQALQASNHGPFDCVLVAGSLFTNETQLQHALQAVAAGQETTEDGTDNKAALPIPCYAIDQPHWVTKGYYQMPGGNAEGVGAAGTEDPEGGSRTRLPQHFSYITSEIHSDQAAGAAASSGLATLHSLTVAFQNIDAKDVDVALVKKSCARAAYRGCDVLLTSSWPAELHHFLGATELEGLRSLNVGLGSGSAGVAKCASTVLPRYHASGGDASKNVFYQRAPYVNASSGHVTVPATRFVSLAHVGATPVPGANAKTAKYIHALSLEPIVHMTDAAICEVPTGVTDCPYGAGTVIHNSNKRSAPGKTEDASKRFKAEGAGATAGANFFGSAGHGPTGMRIGAKSTNVTPPSADATLLFLGGLPTLASEEILKLLPGSISVRRPDGKNFGFAEFESHAAALRIVEESVKRAVLMGGRPITIGWAAASKDPNKSKEAPAAPAGHVLPPPPAAVSDNTQPLSEDCKVLFLGNLPPDVPIQVPGVPLLFASITNTFIGVKAFRRVPNKRYAFVEFSSHGEAQFAFDYARKQGPIKITGAKRGSPTQAGADGKVPAIVDLSGLEEYEISVSWTTTVNATANPVVNNFIRKLPRSSYDAGAYAPPSLRRNPIAPGPTGDHAADCWFCLASPTVKTHLIVSIAEHAYLALPVGALHPLHCLICPIECASSKADLPAECLEEMLKFQTAVEQLYRRQDMAMLTYERAITTRGRNHMQVQCIPVPLARVARADAALSATVHRLASVSATQELIMHELDEEEGRGVESVVATMEGGPYSQYFHCSVPVPVTVNESDTGAAEEEDKEKEAINLSGTDWRHKRYLYVHKTIAAPPPLPPGGAFKPPPFATIWQFPMQMGSDIALAVTEEENADSNAGQSSGKARHWKNKRLTEAEEMVIVEDFRTKFQDLDFTM